MLFENGFLTTDVEVEDYPDEWTNVSASVEWNIDAECRSWGIKFFDIFVYKVEVRYEENDEVKNITMVVDHVIVDVSLTETLMPRWVKWVEANKCDVTF